MRGKLNVILQTVRNIRIFLPSVEFILFPVDLGRESKKGKWENTWVEIKTKAVHIGRAK